MSQKVFSMQMSSAIGIKQKKNDKKINKKSYKKEGIQQTSKKWIGANLSCPIKIPFFKFKIGI